jgi:hypothetical protein
LKPFKKNILGQNINQRLDLLDEKKNLIRALFPAKIFKKGLNTFLIAIFPISGVIELFGEGYNTI